MPAKPFRFTAAQTRRCLRAGVPSGRVREMETDCTREEYEAEVRAAKALLVRVPLSNGTHIDLPPDTVAGFRGLDADGDVVVVGWTTDAHGEYRVSLTPCCLGGMSIFEDGTNYCKGCYGYADSKHGCEADPVVVVPVPPTDPVAAPAVTASPADAPAPTVTAPKETRMTRQKATPAAEQFAALGLTDPTDWTPAMALAVKQKWAALPVDRKVDDLRAELAAVTVEQTATAADLARDTAFAAAYTDDSALQNAATAEASRLTRNAKVNAWRKRNQIQAALDARALKFAAMRSGKTLATAGAA